MSHENDLLYRLVTEDDIGSTVEVSHPNYCEGRWQSAKLLGIVNSQESYVASHIYLHVGNETACWTQARIRNEIIPEVVTIEKYKKPIPLFNKVEELLNSHGYFLQFENVFTRCIKDELLNRINVKFMSTIVNKECENCLKLSDAFREQRQLISNTHELLLNLLREEDDYLSPLVRKLFQKVIYSLRHDA